MADMPSAPWKLRCPCAADEERRAEEVRPDEVTPERGAESPQEATATNG